MKNKKGFTLIELLVVIAVIGVLALIGLRVYGDQQEKAKNAIVIANASTVHTLIQGDLLDHNYPDNSGEDDVDHTNVIINIGGNLEPATTLANMKNPYLGNIAIFGVIDTDLVEGEVVVEWISTNHFEIQGVGAKGKVTGTKLTAIQ